MASISIKTFPRILDTHSTLPKDGEGMVKTFLLTFALVFLTLSGYQWLTEPAPVEVPASKPIVVEAPRQLPKRQVAPDYQRANGDQEVKAYLALLLAVAAESTR